MNTFHKNIGKRWHEHSIFEQMANIGSEVERAIQWKGRNTEYSTLWTKYFMPFTIAARTHAYKTGNKL